MLPSFEMIKYKTLYVLWNYMRGEHNDLSRIDVMNIADGEIVLNPREKLIADITTHFIETNRVGIYDIEVKADGHRIEFFTIGDHRNVAFLQGEFLNGDIIYIEVNPNFRPLVEGLLQKIDMALLQKYGY